MSAALLVVDVQNDFLPGGALAVSGGDEILPVVTRLVRHFDYVAATQDWHPADHKSFAANHPGRKIGDVTDLDGLPQVLWPVHCVQGTPGAAFSAALDVGRFAHIARKGADPAVDSYSGFFDNGRRHATTLEPALRAAGITQLFVVGLATDYCVRATAMDAARLGFDTTLVTDACRGVNLRAGDVDRALQACAAAEITLADSASILP